MAREADPLEGVLFRIDGKLAIVRKEYEWLPDGTFIVHIYHNDVLRLILVEHEFRQRIGIERTPAC